MKNISFYAICLSVLAVLFGWSCQATAAGTPGNISNGWPIVPGEIGPIGAHNALQQPFACVTQDTALGQPVVDNHDGIGFPVTDRSGNVIGYSANCGAPTKVSYHYRAVGDAATAPLRPYDPTHAPTNVASVTINHVKVPLIVRFELGTINRFIYSISALAPKPDVGDSGNPDRSAWNHDLIFYFMGGVGVGHAQSEMDYVLKSIKDPGKQHSALALLAKGYAIINSTGAATDTTYNLVLTGETARMVKQQFVAEYGKPAHTFGLGGSGGSIQQFIYAQNDPGLLDALIPTHVYPDMITQVNPVGDCQLLEYYFDVSDAKVNGTGVVNPKWRSWTKRQLIEGMHGINGFKTKKVVDSSANPGSDACIEAWFAAVPMFFNPLFGATTQHSFSVVPPAVLHLTPLSYFDDLKDIFGTIPGTCQAGTCLARSTYDNVGVQYGLQALKDGKITAHEFLDINAHVGGWKPSQDDVPPGFPYQGARSHGNTDPWSARNATAKDHLAPDDVAPRTQGSIPAMQAAYKAGLVFHGDINKPIIIIEPYFESELNMHATREAFAVRQRLIEAKGNADNLAIWMTGPGTGEQPTQFILRALKVETQWLDSGRRPADVVDACYNDTGALIASGKGVFKGEVSADGSQVLADAKNGGACTKAYPIFSDARVVSGLNVSDHVFKCALKPVSTALTDGIYSHVAFSGAQKARLQQIFATGVCDYAKPDQGLPAGG